MIAEGTKLPDFRLQDQNGKWVSRDDFKGRWLVLYVYPKDDTPGCTIQGKAFTATKADFTALGATVVGLSEDDVASHKSFCNKFSFSIDLLADPKRELLAGLGVGQSEWKGVNYWDRTTFVVGPDADVRKVYAKVNPQGHELTLLQDLKDRYPARLNLIHLLSRQAQEVALFNGRLDARNNVGWTPYVVAEGVLAAGSRQKDAHRQSSGQGKMSPARADKG